MTQTAQPLESEVAELLIATLNIENRSVAEIDPTSALFGAHDVSWGLDSIDALEIALAVQQKYGVELRAEDDASRHALASLRALAGHIATHRRH